jgi:hypothetical protein
MKILLAVIAALCLVGLISGSKADRGKPKPVAPQPPSLYLVAHKTPLPKVDIDFKPNFHGTPGHGLEDSGFEQWRIDAGQAGERALARVIAGARWADDVDVFFSLAVPGFPDIDVDCVVLSGLDLWLLDAKRYRVEDDAAYTCYGGDGTTLYLRRLDADGHPTGEILGEHHISRSTVMARQAFTEQFPLLTIRSATLLTPSANGVYPAIARDAVDATGMRFDAADWYVSHMRVVGGANNPSIIRGLEALCK